MDHQTDISDTCASEDNLKMTLKTDLTDVSDLSLTYENQHFSSEASFKSFHALSLVEHQNSSEIKPSIDANSVSKEINIEKLQCFHDERTNQCIKETENNKRRLYHIDSPRKRMKSENSQENESDLNEKIIQFKSDSLMNCQSKYYNYLGELYFLQHNGDMMDFASWKKNQPSSVLQFFKDNELNPMDLEENLLENISKDVIEKDGKLRSDLTADPNKCPISYKKFRYLKQNHCKQIFETSLSNKEEIVEKAKQEAAVLQRISELRKEGMWSEKRLPKVKEPMRVKVHWDYLLEEMAWMAADFAQEKKWKKAAARKCARMIQKHFQDKALAVQKADREQDIRLRKIASFIAKEIRLFWSNIEKLVEHKQQMRLEEKRKKALDQHLNFIVHQTEKYSSWLAEGMNKIPCSIPSSNFLQDSKIKDSDKNSDLEFEPNQNSDDDESTIAVAEQELKHNLQDEIEILKRESEMPLDEFLKTLPSDFLCRMASPLSYREGTNDLNDDEYLIPSDENPDDLEDTIQEQEETEMYDHKKELQELQIESDLPLNELIKKYSDHYKNLESNHKEVKDYSEELFSEDDLSSSPDEDVGLESLLISQEQESQEINDVAALAESFQPKGYTLSTTKVVTKIPFLLKYSLREYQHIGLDWLVTMCEKKLNGILADEMGLGKTIQTIALFAHLACEKGNWGPHLIVVPTSVMLNWEMEFKKWCPAFKILTYYGGLRERKQKRIGWTKPNAFHVCITSYKLVIQDHGAFRRKRWKYLVLDEAQNIKNFKSQRWELLLNFRTQRRLLLTGTPLQNSLMELWSLMHFLMPHVFHSHKEFKEWFSNPVVGMIEGSQDYNDSIIKRLHKVLRPFLLRRLKSEVEKQLPQKFEHIQLCSLSKRQRFLYDDFMARTKTKETLSSGNFLSVINVLMQLRKVCNHPNLFDPRPIISPLIMEGLLYYVPSLLYIITEHIPLKHVNLLSINANLLELEMNMSAFEAHRVNRYKASIKLIEESFSNVIVPSCPHGKVHLHIRTSESSIDLNTNASNMQTKLQPKSGEASFLQNLLNHTLVFTHQGITKTISFGQLLQYNQSIRSNPTPIALHILQTIQGPKVLLPSSLCNSHGQSAILLPTSNQCTTGAPVISVRPTPVQSSKYNSLYSTPMLNSSVGRNSVLRANSAPTNNAILGNKPIMRVTPMRVSDSCQLTTDKSMPSNIVNGDFRPMKIKKIDPLQNLEMESLEYSRREASRCLLSCIAARNIVTCEACPIYGTDLIKAVSFDTTQELNFNLWNTYDDLHEYLDEIIKRFVFCTPAVSALPIEMYASHIPPSLLNKEQIFKLNLKNGLKDKLNLLHKIITLQSTQFPDLRLIQYDCGKLKILDELLRKLRKNNHRLLIFTQMTKMLDILEQFLNYHGYRYLRLDGTTRVDQRQVLMERFNADKRIFCFILSTRSGGIGVNLTGADTVIFYDSDWNPTMDAQAQDRCHRIGQTRDVHIYRLISEKTIEENILKKANQKRLLGDLAIEGGNFTTAHFKKQTIHELFNILSEDESCKSIPDIMQDTELIESNLQVAEHAFESALATVEDDLDVTAAKSAKAEVVADLAEFDESIPIVENDDEISKAEAEVKLLMDQLTPIEKYAICFVETEHWSAELFAQAEAEIEQQKRNWEQQRLQALKEQEEQMAELDSGELLTYPRKDAANQIWVDPYTGKIMDIWTPPTPPHDTGDIYIDSSLSFLYGNNVLNESQLPPVYIKKEIVKKLKPEIPQQSNMTCHSVEMKVGVLNRSGKMRKDESLYAPRSLFDRPSPAIAKLRRDAKLQKYRGIVRPHVAFPGFRSSVSSKPSSENENIPEWHIHEEWALLQAIQSLQEFPLNLVILSPGHIPNWDMVADMVNSVAYQYRSPKQCKNHYENVLVPREEGKLTFDPVPKKIKKPKTPFKLTFPTSRSVKTSQLFVQDNNTSFSSLFHHCFDVIRSLSKKKSPATKSVFSTPMIKNPKHTAVLAGSGINYDSPLTPLQVATNRMERLAREKEKHAQSVELAVQKRLQQVTKLRSSPVPTIIPLNVTYNQPPVISTSNSSLATALRAEHDVCSGQCALSDSVVTVANLAPLQLQTAHVVPSNSPIQTSKATATSTLIQTSNNTKALTPAQIQYHKQQALLRKQQQTLQDQQKVQQLRRVHTSTAFFQKTLGRQVSEVDINLLRCKSQLEGTAQVMAQGNVQIHQATSNNQSSTPALMKTSPVTIPVSAISVSNMNLPQVKTAGSMKSSAKHQIRHIAISPQLLSAKKSLQQQKVALAKVSGKTGLPQLSTVQIVQSQKQLPTVTVQQVIRQMPPQTLHQLSQVSTHTQIPQAILTKTANTQGISNQTVTVVGGVQPSTYSTAKVLPQGKQVQTIQVVSATPALQQALVSSQHRPSQSTMPSTTMAQQATILSALQGHPLSLTLRPQNSNSIRVQANVQANSSFITMVSSSGSQSAFLPTQSNQLKDLQSSENNESPEETDLDRRVKQIIQAVQQQQQQQLQKSTNTLKKPGSKHI